MLLTSKDLRSFSANHLVSTNEFEVHTAGENYRLPTFCHECLRDEDRSGNERECRMDIVEGPCLRVSFPLVWAKNFEGAEERINCRYQYTPAYTYINNALIFK